MANEKEKKKQLKSLSAKKRDRQNAKRCERNKVFKSRVKSAVVAFKEEVLKGNKEATQKTLDTLYSLMDKGVKRGLIKQNKANRIKSRSKAKTVAKA